MHDEDCSSKNSTQRDISIHINRLETPDKISESKSLKKGAIAEDDTEWHQFFNTTNNERHSRRFMQNK